MPYLRLAQRREQLVEAAIAVALRDGLPALTVRKVAEEAGTALGTVHYCFASKGDLLAAVATRLTDDVVSAVQSALEPSRDVERVLRGAMHSFWGVVEQDPRRQLLTFELVTWSLRGGQPDLARRQYELLAAAATRLLDDVAAAAGVTWSVPLPTLAKMALTITDGVTLAWLVDGDREAAIAAMDAFAALVAAASRPAGARTSAAARRRRGA